MKIEITKKQEIVNDVAKEALYTVRIIRDYGIGDIPWQKDDLLYEFDEEDMRELARVLSEKFLPNP